MYQAGKLRRCGMESAALTTADLQGLEAFHSQSFRKVERIIIVASTDCAPGGLAATFTPS